MSTVLLTKDDPRRGIAQVLCCLQKAGANNYYHALQIAEDTYKRNPLVAHALKRMVEWQTKGAIGAATTAATGWATELAPIGINHEAFLLWQNRSITGRVLALARRVPWRAASPKETGAGATAGWRGESLPALVAKTTFDTFRVDYKEASIISVVTNELFRLGATAELSLTDYVIESVNAYTDQQFLDPTVAETSTRPGAITNGAQPVSSTGNSAAQIVADLGTMVAAMDTASESFVWIMRPKTYNVIAARLAGVGLPTTPGFLLGIPVVLGAKSPQQITLVDPSNIAYATDGEVRLDLSTQADVQMDSAPTQSGVAGTGASVVSLFQTSMTGIKADVGISWETIRYSLGSPTVSDGVVYMTVTY